MSSSGFISLFGKNCFVGEGFAERDVALERDDKTGVIGVRYANVKLGDLADSPNARLQPTASAERWGRVHLKVRGKKAKKVTFSPCTSYGYV